MAKKFLTRELLTKALVTLGIPAVEAKEMLDDPESRLLNAVFRNREAQDCVHTLTRWLYKKADVECKGWQSVLSSEDTFSYALTKDGMAISLPTKQIASEVKELQVRHLFNFDQVSEEFLSRNLEPGAYVIVGRPASGKSTLGQAAMKSLIKAGFSVAAANLMEPISLEMRKFGCVAAIGEQEIAECINILISSDADVIYIDSLRFLAAISKFPARPGGIPGGLDLYATVLDEAAARVGKRAFLVITTNDSRAEVNETYAILMQGAVQGIIVPSEMTASDVGTLQGRGEFSLRGADRTRIPFSATLDSPITLPIGLETLHRVKREQGASEINEVLINKMTNKEE